MEAIEISEDRRDSFLKILGEDLSEDMKRLYYRGIGVRDEEGNPVGAMVLELMNADSDEENEGRICFLHSGSQEIFDALQSFYLHNTVEEEEVAETVYELSDDSEIRALSEAGFSSEKKESESVCVTLGQLSDSKLAKGKKPPGHIRGLGSLSVLQYRSAMKQILFKGHSGVLEDIAYLPMGWFDLEVSSCVVSGDLIPGLFLIRKTPSGMLIPVLFYAYGPESKIDLYRMLEYSVQEAVRLYPPETPIMVIRKNPSIRALTDKLLPGLKGNEIYRGTRKE